MVHIGLVHIYINIYLSMLMALILLYYVID